MRLAALAVGVLASAYALMLCGTGNPARAIEISLCPPAHFKKYESESKRFPRCGSTVWVSGRFVPGDAEKLRAFLRKNLDVVMKSAGSLRSVTFFRSDGGDVLEAIQVGELIRRLYLTTDVGGIGDFNSQRVAFSADFSSDILIDSTCAGACIFAWAGGILRGGNYALLPEVIPSAPKEMTAYAERMGLPTKMFLKDGWAESNPGQALPPAYVARELNIFPKRKYEFCATLPLQECADEDSEVFQRISIAIQQELGVTP